MSSFFSCFPLSFFFFFFFFNDTATTEIYTLSLHDALPISFCSHSMLNRKGLGAPRPLPVPSRLVSWGAFHYLQRRAIRKPLVRPFGVVKSEIPPQARPDR